MFEKTKKQTIQRPKASVDQKPSFFCETKKTRIAMNFILTCLTAPHLPYGPNSSQKRILRNKKKIRAAPSFSHCMDSDMLNAMLFQPRP